MPSECEFSLASALSNTLTALPVSASCSGLLQCTVSGKGNIDQKENKALRSLRQTDCVVKCSDKSKSLVIMSTNQYIEKAQAILNDAGKYEVTDMTAEKLEKQVSTLLK